MKKKSKKVDIWKDLRNLKPRRVVSMNARIYISIESLTRFLMIIRWISVYSTDDEVKSEAILALKEFEKEQR